MKSTYILSLAALFAVACDNNINGSNEVKATAPAITSPATPLSDTLNKSTAITPSSANQPVPANNPPHGQPGHVCGPAGGTPSIVSPSNSVSASSTAPAPVQPSSTLPVQSGSSNGNAGVRLNPAHGQPGHDCNIEVGKPLKQ